MKRGILCFVLATFFALPALAAAEVHGIYIAPKFLFGIQDSGNVSSARIFVDAGSKGYKQHSQAVFGGALAVGYNFTPKFNIPIRAEIEYALRSNSSHNRDGSDISHNGNPFNWETKYTSNISTFFFNAYFDITTGSPFTPYIGGGLGMAFNYTYLKAAGVDTVTNQRYQQSRDQYDTTFAWNVGVGLSYAFTENVSADLGYRFIGTGYREVKSSGVKLVSSS